MKGWSTSAGDHHWQAGCAIEQLATENETLREENERLLFANLYNTDMFNQMNDARKEAEQERDQLKAQVERLRLAALKAIQHMPGGVNKADLRDAYDETPEQSLALHNAEVVERFCDYAQTKYRFGLHSIAKDYADQLRQQTKEA
jgi:hypothetical protein